VGLRFSLDGCGKSRPPMGLYPPTVQLVACRYKDYVIPALCTRLQDIKTQKTITDPIFIAILFKIKLILIYYILLS